MKYRVILRRANGRYVQEWPARSKYDAKRIKKRKEDKYDETYYLEVKPV